MELGPFLKELRLRRGHSSIGALATYAKALGQEISRESIRLFENEKKVPTPQTRKLLSHILKLNVYEKYVLEKLCAESHIRSKFDLGQVVLLDQESIEVFSKQVHSISKKVLEEILPIDEPASEEDIEAAAKKVGELCTTALEGPKTSSI